MNESLITISRPSFGDGSEVICIRITDKASGVLISETTIGYSEFTEALTGVSRTACNTKVLSASDLQKVGKKKITKQMFCDKDFKGWGKEGQKIIVEKHFQENCADDGWQMFSDGTSTQQNGELHKYLVVKWENTDEAI